MLRESVSFGAGSLSKVFHLLALFRLLADHPRAMRFLLLRFGHAENVFAHADRADMAEAGIRNPVVPRLDSSLEKQVSKDLSWLEKDHHHLIQLEDTIGATGLLKDPSGDAKPTPAYPQLLRQIYDPPCLLFARGELPQPPGDTVAIVGSRSATRYGLKQAELIAFELAAAGVVIVSGLALGIDSAAHYGALNAGGTTLAILGTGCDEIYPTRNRRLAEKIMGSGVLLSEFPLGTRAFPANFPRRNRIVTGMSRATVVVEAALKSGSLISAQLATAEGRDVMAIPGLVTNRQARGCHKLLREGALLVESAADVLGELGISPLAGAIESNLSDLQGELLKLMQDEPKSVDVLEGVLNVPLSELLPELVGLEILGLVHSEGGLYVRST
jgi:DNA processing protein